jgi:post-segregation antitoxin (ccd killing protein)
VSLESLVGDLSQLRAREVGVNASTEKRRSKIQRERDRVRELGWQTEREGESRE